MSDAYPLAPDSASSFAPSYDLLFFSLLGMTVLITVGIAGLVLFYCVRYRRRHDDQFGQPVPSSTLVEVIWTVIPLIVSLGIYVWAATLYFRMSEAPANAMVIQVVGKQWMWKLQHPGGRKEINELHVPLGQAVKLQMTSEDVIHAFYVPAFRIKQAVVPGRYSQEWFLPTKVGEYEFFCSEYCGTSHAQMRGRVVVMPPGDYEKWAANAALDDRPEIAGGHLFTQYGCAACHGQQAPTLSGVYGQVQVMQDGSRVVADENYLRESILFPRAKLVAGYPPIMPSFDGQLSEEQILQIIAYIKSLKAPVGPQPAVPSFGASP